MPFVITWMDLEGFMIIEVNQTKKDKHHMISLIRGIFKKKTKTKHKTPHKKPELPVTENRLVVVRGRG